MNDGLSLSELQQSVPHQHRTWIRVAITMTLAGYLVVALSALSVTDVEGVLRRSETIAAACMVGALLLERSGRPTLGLAALMAIVWLETVYSLLRSPLGARSSTGPGLLALLIGAALLLGRRYTPIATVLALASWTVTLALARILGTGRGLRLEEAMAFSVVACVLVLVGALLHLVQGYFEQVLQSARSHAKRASELLEQAPDGIVALDGHGRVAAFNRRAEQILGLTATEALGKTAFELPLRDDAGRPIALKALAAAGPVTRELTVDRSDDAAGASASLGGVDTGRLGSRPGATTFVEASVRETDDEHGRRGLLVMLRDITERKAAEQHAGELAEQLQQAQKMEALGQLAGGVAHDFNNLLTAIGGYAQLIDRRSDTVDVKQLSRQLVDAQQRGAALTKQLLAFARRERAIPRHLDVARFLKTMRSLLQHLAGSDVTLTLDVDEACPVLLDPTQFEQVMLNLVANGRDAMPGGGVLRIGARLEGDAVVVTVEDEGVGMAPEVREHVFEPFFTTKGQGKGTGLGLSTVHGIVVESGGTIAIDSAPGDGARFTLRWPRTSAEAPASEPLAQSERRSQRHGSGVVLLAEDDAPTRQLIEQVLEGRGFTVVPAATGSEAMTVIDGLDKPPLLLLSDVVLPGATGPDVARHLRRRFPRAPVLFMSGYLDGISLGDGFNPAKHLLSKPFDVDELLDRVLRASRTARPAPQGGAANA